LFLSGIGVYAVAQVRQRLSDAEAALPRSDELLAKNHYHHAVETLEHALDLATNTVGGGELAERLTVQLDRARAQEQQAEPRQAAQSLHALVDRLRFVDSPQALTKTQLTELDRQCRTLWDARRRLLPARLVPGDPTTQQLTTDLHDLAIIGAEVRVRLLG